jgi:membrane protease YdiL (CAAX protease family)
MILGGIALALILWALTFGVSWGNFWVKIGLSVLSVCLYSSLWQRPKLKFSVDSIVLGVVSAAALYGIFFVGNGVAPLFLSESHTQVGSIYALGTGTSKLAVFLLLFFITGPGEEIFWRGFLQQKLADRWGKYTGFVVATLIYSGVHLFSLNLMLILAALVAGAFWGALYLWKGDLVLQIVSHSLWSSVIFAVAHIH